MKKYKIYLDFDGTCVEFAYPQIGQANFGCIEVIEKLQQAGHTIVLNTYRVECKNGTLEQALEWFESAWNYLADEERSRKKDLLLRLPFEYTSYKRYPGCWDWDSFNANNLIFIDDECKGIPLKKCCIRDSYMVDWEELDKQFQNHNIY